MKKLLSCVLAALMIMSVCAIASLTVSAADAVVYVDGTKDTDGSGTKDSPFNNLVSAFKALAETGGTVTIIGDVEGNAVLTTHKTETDDDGNVHETEEWVTGTINLPRHKNTIVVTSDGGALCLGTTTGYRFENYDSTIYRNCTFKFGSSSNRIMFDSFDGHLVVEENCTMNGTDGHYIYCTGSYELYAPCNFAHAFINYGYTEKQDTVFVLGKSAAVGTIWYGYGEVESNVAVVMKDSASINNFTGGQIKGIADNCSVWYYAVNGNAPTATVKSNSISIPKSFIIGAESGEFAATAADYTVAAASDNTALFNKVAKEYKVTGDVKSFVKVDSVDESNKLYAIVDGEAVEIKYFNTNEDGAFFSTVEGATNYVFADGLKKADEGGNSQGGNENQGGNGGGTSVKTGDPIVVLAVIAVVSLAGAVVVKKVR